MSEKVDLERAKDLFGYLHEVVSQAETSLSNKLRDDDDDSNNIQLIPTDEELNRLITKNLWTLIKSYGVHIIQLLARLLKLIPTILLTIEGGAANPQIIVGLVRSVFELIGISLTLTVNDGKAVFLLFRIAKRALQLILKPLMKVVSNNKLPSREREEITTLIRAAQPLVESEKPNQKQALKLLETARAVESQSEEDEAGDSSDSDDEDFNVPSRRRRFHSSSLDNRAMYRRRNQPIYPSYKKPRMKWWKIVLIVLFTMIVISGIFTFLKINKYL
ncbi:predicted protein [Naegleria gruberi]|uniref:Predicted protein n=1 Tax=Naegleria gruberi TaxID=5762 RepID=D2VQA1_NAEGR|nr:uncharacterized protein NAEGRDRAFT_71077 [Naegleria gruberi]EFC41009.1 predicted protein [Naegleria gruberi]|eukprot:XP_002673753.1 predicted protein [Naegleria gruberi strain NEG-M]